MDIINMIRSVTGFVVGTETPYFYESKVEHYEKRIYPSTFFRFKEFMDSKPSVTTDQQILFRKIPFNSNKSEIINILGEPRFVLKKKLNGSPYTVLFYKELTGKHNLVSQIHLLDDFYFYASFSINSSDKDSVNYVKKLVLEKYNITQVEELTKEQLCISDKNKNKILSDMDVYFRFCYLTGNQVVLKQLKEVIDSYGKDRFFFKIEPDKRMEELIQSI